LTLTRCYEFYIFDYASKITITCIYFHLLTSWYINFILYKIWNRLFIQKPIHINQNISSFVQLPLTCWSRKVSVFHDARMFKEVPLFNVP